MKKKLIDLIIVLFFNVFTGFLTFLFFTILAKKANLEVFGNFNTINEFLLLLMTFTDLGLNISFIRFNTKFLEEDKKKSIVLMGLVIKIKIFISLVLLILVFLGNNLIINKFLKVNNQSVIVLAFFTSIIYMSIISFISATYQSYEKFIKMGIVNLIAPCIKLVLLLFLTMYLKIEINLKMMLLLFLISSVIGSFFSWNLLKRDFKFNILEVKILENKEYFKNIINFGKWLTLLNILTVLIGKTDVFMLRELSNIDEIAYYSAGQKLAFFLPVLTNGLTTILLPKASKIKRKNELKEYIKLCLGLIILVLVPIGVIMLVSKDLILLFLGVKYLNSIIVFKIIISTFIIELFCIPFSLLIYVYEKTKYVVLIQLLTLIINIYMNTRLIPFKGAEGAALATLSSRIICVPLVLFVVILLLKKELGVEKV
ncbi:MAG: oligosaccharide flippase family protein [Cetobacterium sp.]|uniref:oligosaccharide flippase family protein n=1 Tax=Cetobacterium sp. TaxID=2071632 RepID=UPI003EE50E50